jgi:hypothetical protein
MQQIEIILSITSSKMSEFHLEGVSKLINNPTTPLKHHPQKQSSNPPTPTPRCKKHKQAKENNKSKRK